MAPLYIRTAPKWQLEPVQAADIRSMHTHAELGLEVNKLIQGEARFQVAGCRDKCAALIRSVKIVLHGEREGE